MPLRTKEKRPPITCETCQKEFQTVQALKAHTLAKHSEDQKMLQNNSACSTESKEEKKTAFVPPTSRASKRLQLKKSVDKDTVIETKTNGSHSKSATVAVPVIQAVFECPKCLKVFNVYFSAYKHLQKRHCVDIAGNPVPPNSPALIKPIRREMCTLCNKLVHGETHCCANSNVEETKKPDMTYVIGTTDMTYVAGGSYSCLGCKRSYGSVVAFDNHIPGFHSDNVDTMFFESHDEFLLWKCNMESQVKVKYQTLSNTVQKQIYHCNYVSPKNSANVTHLCPSVLIAKELAKGIQIHYHKQHNEHTCEYKLPKQFEDYIVSADSENDIFNSILESKDDEDDLYVKFRSLLKSIIFGAARINVKHLKKLYAAALEMQTCLNSYDDEREYADSALKMLYLPRQDKAETVTTCIINIPDVKGTEMVKDTETKNKSMNDDQITKALETRASGRLKRKSLSNSDAASGAKETATGAKETATGAKDTAPGAKKKKLNPVNKTKSDLKENSTTKDSKLQSPKVTNKTPPFSQSPSFNDSYKQFIDTTLKVPTKETTTRKTTKKEVVKTKIGQFTPSPKKAAQIKVSYENVVKAKRKESKPPGASIISDKKLKDIEYEVVEQENDCNILVLKI